MKKYKCKKTIDMSKWSGIRGKNGSPLMVRYSGVDLLDGRVISKDHPFQVHKDKLEKDWHKNYILKGEVVTISNNSTDKSKYFIHRKVTRGVEVSFIVDRRVFDILIHDLEKI